MMMVRSILRMLAPPPGELERKDDIYDCLTTQHTIGVPTLKGETK